MQLAFDFPIVRQIVVYLECLQISNCYRKKILQELKFTSLNYSNDFTRVTVNNRYFKLFSTLSAYKKS